eukprot:12892207-Prorocentrum_lima.AAC.1
MNILTLVMCIVFLNAAIWVVAVGAGSGSGLPKGGLLQLVLEPSHALLLKVAQQMAHSDLECALHLQVAAHR